VDAGLDRQQELPCRRRDREERRIEPREGRLAGEDAEVVDEVIDGLAGRLRSP
jgi:hypothetical protein